MKFLFAILFIFFVLEASTQVLEFTPTPRSLEEAPESVTVIADDVLEEESKKSAVEIFDAVPGVHIDSPGSQGSVSSIYIRGGDPSFTTVLIDGVKVNDPMNSRGGSFDISSIDPESIERVEVIRGPLSSIYGSDAISGAINIITKKATDKAKQQVSLSYGETGYHKAHLNASGPLESERLTYQIGTSYQDNGELVDGDQMKLAQTLGKLSWMISEEKALNFHVRYAHQINESFPEDSGGPEQAVLRILDHRQVKELSTGLGYESRTALGFSINWNFYRREEDFSSPGITAGQRSNFGVPANTSDSEFDRHQLLTKFQSSIGNSWKWSLGADLQYEEGESDNTLDTGSGPTPSTFEHNRSQVAPLGELVYLGVKDLTLQFGFRLDYPVNYSPEFSPRVGVNYWLSSWKTAFKANWGQGFKVPSLFALGNPIVGNENLAPETSDSFDVGFVKHLGFKKSEVGLTYFYSDFENLIDFDTTTSKLVNRDRVFSSGAELHFKITPLYFWELKTHATYVETQIRGSNDRLLNRPRFRSGIENFVLWKKLKAGISVLYVGEMKDSAEPTGTVVLDDYYKTDLTFAYQFSKTLEASVVIANLFDEDYEEAVGFNGAGRNGKILVKSTF